MRGSVTEVSDTTFENEVLKSSQPVLVDFWAEWCAPCRALGPVVEVVAEKYEGQVKVVKLNVDESIDISSRYSIKGIPTVIVFHNGKEVERVVSAPANAKNVISSILDKQLSTDADAGSASEQACFLGQRIIRLTHAVAVVDAVQSAHRDALEPDQP